MRHIRKNRLRIRERTAVCFSLRGESQPEADDRPSLNSEIVCATLKARAVPSLIDGCKVWIRHQNEPYVMQLAGN